MTSFPPLLPADGSLSNEMHLLQGAGHKAAFYNRPSDQRFFAEFIGDETEESVLPRIYEFWLRKLGMSADFHRRIVTPQEIGEYVSAAITNQAWRGCNLSPSLKRAAVSHVSLMAVDRERMPFVDTLFRYKAGWPAGLTTIGVAFWSAFTSKLTDADSAKVWMAGFQIVGSGAVATTIAAVLMGQQITNVWVYCRNLDAGKTLARFVGLAEERVLPLDALRPLPAAAFGPGYGQRNVVINATLLGVVGEPAVPIDLGAYPADTQVVDFAGQVEDTVLVSTARGRGFPVTPGLQIAIEQAAQAFFFFYLTQAPRQFDAELIASLGA